MAEPSPVAHRTASLYHPRMRSLGPLLAFTLLYAMIYGAFGVASPFWPRFFESRGVSAGQLGVLLAAGTFVRLISGPLVGGLADRSAALRAVLAACAALAATAALGLLLVDGFWALLLVHLAQASSLAPITMLADALALNAAKRTPEQGGFEYGWVRGSGSAAFVAGTLLAGQILGVAGLSAIAWMHAGFLVTAVLGSTLVPPLEAPPSEPKCRTPSPWAGARELWNTRVFRHLTIVAAMVLGSHAMHDAFAVIRWSEAGIQPFVTSVLWSEAVAAEVVMFFLVGPALVVRFGPSRTAALAATAGVVRWAVMAQTTSVSAIAIVQPLHGLTFALLHLACMRLIGAVVPARLAATAQSLYAFGAGLATAALTLFSGTLYAAFGGTAFLLMAVLCGLAVPLAWFGLRLRADRPEQKEAVLEDGRG